MNTEIEAGWVAVGTGPTTSSGQAEVGCSGGDPSLVLAIASTSSLYGPGQTQKPALTRLIKIF